MTAKADAKKVEEWETIGEVMKSYNDLVGKLQKLPPNARLIALSTIKRDILRLQ